MVNLLEGEKKLFEDETLILTNKRLIKDEDDYFSRHYQEIPISFIDSVEYKMKMSGTLLIAGIILIIMGLILFGVDYYENYDSVDYEVDKLPFGIVILGIICVGISLLTIRKGTYFHSPSGTTIFDSRLKMKEFMKVFWKEWYKHH